MTKSWPTSTGSTRHRIADPEHTKFVILSRVEQAERVEARVEGRSNIKNVPDRERL
jgi:hypothetical protein